MCRLKPGNLQLGCSEDPGAHTVCAIAAAAIECQSTTVTPTPSPQATPQAPPPSAPPRPDFGCLDFEAMADVRDADEWCSSPDRNSNPDACNNAFATTFPNEESFPGYFHTPRIHRNPSVRVQRQRCWHNNLDGDAARCTMEAKQYQCATPITFNCSYAHANDIQRPPNAKWCSAMETKELCEAKYAHAGTPWTVHGITGKNYRPCYWVEGAGCSLAAKGLNCRDPDAGARCIDVWNTAVVGDITCADLATALARDNAISLQAAAAQVGSFYTVCAPCALSS
mmetsp:Transcript_21403/g.46658  ORF Transcript_21403/g.46658 Transcript_21403/m.46658 type:complete len:282 (+) Transcript_21403:915-1760(+)